MIALRFAEVHNLEYRNIRALGKSERLVLMYQGYSLFVLQ